MPLTAGARLGTYEILAPLGAGGMGEVYRARDLRLGREIALKVLPADVASHPDRLARFEREARTVAGLNHPNIVTLFSVEDDRGVRFLTMELVEGQSLDHLVTPGGLPVPRVIELGIALADALAAAHEKGVIHRDLKPANVMVTKDGRVKVLDFGLAKLAVSDLDPSVTQAPTALSPISGAGLVVGTVPYMAPEQIQGETVDARTDLFALGIVLYELASGKRPFAGETQVDVGHAILREAPKPLANVRSDVPRDLERIVGECLEKNPRERVQTALDVSNALRRLRKELERSVSGMPVKPASEKVASIAVLPFVNRSASADDEYFSDGLADELLNVLAKIKGLRVVARASAFQFKRKNEDLAVIGAKLNVATVLDGSVRKAGNRIRVSVQLVNVADNSHLWSEQYDRTLEDIFAVQDDIAQSVVKELRTTLLGEASDSDASGQAKAEVAQAAKGRGRSTEAHRLYLQARHFIDWKTEEKVARGISCLEQALELDPDFALAWAELSHAHALEAGQGWAPVAEGFGRARASAERALSLEPDLAEGHAAMGWIQMRHNWDWEGARHSFERALESAPGNSQVLRMAGVFAWIQGRFEQAIGLFRSAIEQDPLSAMAHENLGQAHHGAGHLAEAAEALRKASELAPDRGSTRSGLALVLLDQGQWEAALTEAMQEPNESKRFYSLAIVHHVAERPEDAAAALQQLIQKHGTSSAFQIAEVFATRTDPDRAFDWLERAYAERDPGLPSVKVIPGFRPLHGDPRWGAFLRKMGLEG